MGVEVEMDKLRDQVEEEKVARKTETGKLKSEMEEMEQRLLAERDKLVVVHAPYLVSPSSTKSNGLQNHHKMIDGE